MIFRLFIGYCAVALIIANAVAQDTCPPPLPDRETTINASLSATRDLMDGLANGADQISVTEPSFTTSKAFLLSRNWLPNPGGTLHATLADGEAVEVIVDKTVPESGGLFTVGHIADHPELPVFFGSYADSVVGQILTATGKKISVMPSSNGMHIIGERPLDLNCGLQATSGSITDLTEDVAPDAIGSDISMSPMTNGAINLSDATIEFDIMCVYSHQVFANTFHSNPAEVLSQVILDIGYLNDAFLNSGCATRARLVYCGQINRDEAASAVDWGWFSSNPAPTEVATLQDTYHPDVSWFLTTHGTGFGDAGLAVCMSAPEPYHFAHEVGHTFGCHHHILTDGPGFGYAYGYKVPYNGYDYATLMTFTYYGNFVLPFYSNPDIQWQGLALGDASTADNHRVINENRVRIAGMRSAIVAGLGNAGYSPSQGFSFDLTGATTVAGSYSVEYTSEYTTDTGGADTTQWTNLNVDGGSTFTFSGGTKTIHDYSITGVSQRFYRAKKGTALIGSELGFFKTTVPAGYSMVGNPLDADDNRVSRVIINPPDGLSVEKWDPGRDAWADSNMYYVLGGIGQWTNPNMSFGPGEGLVFYCPAQTEFMFIGKVWTGFEIHLGTGWQIVSSAAPQGGLVSAKLKFPVIPPGYTGKVFPMTGNNTYTEYRSAGTAPGYYYWTALIGGTWLQSEPTIPLGRAFWCYRTDYREPSWDDENFWRRVFWTWP
jgi:hypothetical protein